MALINLLPRRLITSQTLLLHHHHLLPLILHPLLPSSSFQHSPNNHSYSSSSSSSSSATHPSLSSPPTQETTPHLPNHFSLSSLKPSLYQNFSDDSTHIDFQFEEQERDVTYKKPNDPDTHLFIKFLSQAKKFSSEEDALAFLDESLSGVRPTEALVCSGIWALRNEWELGFLAFKWGEKLGCCNSPRAWDLMIWVLGKQRRFGVAWRLVRKMFPSSIDSRRALLIMIESYAAANKPDKAIRTFQAMEKFRIIHDSKALYTLLRSLCKYGDVELAEEFMLVNKNFFPLETESFNIILNGWSSITPDVVEAKRIWREMSNYCITPNAISYTHMISCFSKVGNLFDSLRLYDEMKKRGWVPGLGVYNSLVNVLTRENCLKDALNLLEKIKEAGLKPDSTTYNSIILPLCEAQKLEEACIVLANMVSEGLDPTTVTYHAFVAALAGVSLEGTLELLKQMREAGYGPNGDTFLLIFNKFLKSEQPENTLRMWMEMKKYEVVPDSAHYSVLVRGLAECGWIVKARELYDEMRSRGFIDDPKLEKLLKGAGKK